jgi:hypothetical protein
VGSSVTNNTTRVRIGYRICSLWRFTAAHITITDLLLTQQLTTKYRLSDLTPLTTETLLNTGLRLL